MLTGVFSRMQNHVVLYFRVLVAAAAIVTLFSPLLAVDVVPHTNGMTRERLMLRVKSPYPDFDSLVTKNLTEQLSARFDIVDSAYDYWLQLAGAKDSITDTMFSIKGFAFTSDNPVVHYQVTFATPTKGAVILFKDLKIEDDWLWGTGNDDEDVAERIMNKIENRYPPLARVASVDGNTARLDLGSRAGLHQGDLFQTYDMSGRRYAVVEIKSLDSTEAITQRVMGRGLAPGYIARRLPRISELGIGLEYTHFRVNHAGRQKTGGQVMLTLPYKYQPMAPFFLQLSTGYLDVVQEDGWHLVNLDLIYPVAIIKYRLYLEAQVGLGQSLLRLSDKIDSVTNKKIESLGTFNYNASLGLSLNITRQMVLTAGCGYLGYSRFPRPNGPSLLFGARWLGI
jgi:hypothetical protein